ncbi:LysR family transcriptional regulator [Gordonia hydrophobica]|uniref:LysR family transcriptional regulator n=1 Tax=Gordonia hydrophobica TaxID=40516 RepID=A0ABZ2U0E6_9ACTN|nr:LysR family transcriptional regulator [Gordonia hydrophobica]MBM7366317.1 DNA-binding transcriptional LysR family regulator [Gordonia hydrophobica]
MDVRHLELLRELAERGSVTAVARATHRTVSAVSQQLRTAQREFGMALVEPAGRGVRLTDAGRLLAAGGVEVHTAIAAVQAQWDAYRRDPGGLVSVNAFPSAATLVFPHLIGEATAHGITLRLDDVDPAESEIAAMTADYDIVVTHSLDSPRPAASAGLTVRELVTEPLDIAMRADHPLAAKHRLHAADVRGATWFGVPEGYPFDSVLRGIEQTLGEPPDVRQRLRDNRVIEHLVAAGDSLAVLPRFTTRVDDAVVLREIVDVPARRYLAALMRPDRAERHAVRTVLGWLTEAAQAHGGMASRSAL